VVYTLQTASCRLRPSGPQAPPDLLADAKAILLPRQNRQTDTNSQPINCDNPEANCLLQLDSHRVLTFSTRQIVPVSKDRRTCLPDVTQAIAQPKRYLRLQQTFGTLPFCSPQLQKLRLKHGSLRPQ